MRLLAPHRAYLGEIERLWQAGITVKGMAHITGGGLIDNPPRIFPAGVAARLRRDAWPVPALFRLIQETGHIGDDEMAHVFNLGLGMLVVVPADQALPARAVLGDGCRIAGEMVRRGDGPAVQIV